MEQFCIVKKIVKSECIAVYRSKSSIVSGLVFFILIPTLWVLSIPKELVPIDKLAPSIIWVSLLLVIFFSLEKIFRHDYVDGSLIQWKLSLGSLKLYVLSKLISHWLINTIPLIIITPLLGLMFHLPVNTLFILTAAVLLASWIFIALGCMVITLTLRIESNSVLVAIMLFPLYVPVLLLGTATTLFASSDLVSAYLALLLALAIISGLISPFIAASGLNVALS